MPGTYTTKSGRESYKWVAPTRDNGCPVIIDGKECRMRVYISGGKVSGSIQLASPQEFYGRRLSTSRKKRKAHIAGDWEVKSNLAPQTIWVFSYPVTATRRERRRVYENVVGWLTHNGVKFEPKFVESLVIGGSKIAAQHALEQKHRAILTKGDPAR